MTVSVLVVSYRAYAELDRCLRSLQRWHGDQVEVIVVDHESSGEALTALKAAYPWCQFLPTDANPGFAAGVNRAAREARGRYLLLLNPDSDVVEDVAGTLAAWMDAHPSVGSVGALVRDEDGAIQASARAFPGLSTVLGGRSTRLTRLWPANPWTRRNLLTGPEVTTPRAVDWVSGACLMTRRELFDALEGFDEGFFLYWEDADYCRRARDRGWPTWYYPGVSVIHLAGRSSAKARWASRVAFHDSVYRYFRKHTGPIGRVLSPVVWLGVRARLALERRTAGDRA